MVSIMRASLNNELRKTKEYKKSNDSRREIYEKWRRLNFI
jgi:hypothetical protein